LAPDSCQRLITFALIVTAFAIARKYWRSRCAAAFTAANRFPPSAIVHWVDKWEGVGQTALCPNCSIDSVIGSESGYPITRSFLERMKGHWFA